MPSKKTRIQVYVSDEEYKAILASAERAGISLSSFAKHVCLGSVVPSVAGAQFRMELRALKADLGRLGGLLKLWLTEKDSHAIKVREVLREIEARQDDLKNIIARV